MEVPDEVGRALIVPVNATSVRAWKFTFNADASFLCMNKKSIFLSFFSNFVPSMYRFV